MERVEWQEDKNCVWFTNIKPKCDICGKKVDNSMEIKTDGGDHFLTTCLLNDSECFHLGVRIMFGRNPDLDSILMRGVKYKQVGVSKKRESIGLSKRYDVMKRDGFQCVLCGTSGRNARLEIDHIIPISSGGSNKADNLQTLCFKCNRGKRDKVEV